MKKRIMSLLAMTMFFMGSNLSANNYAYFEAVHNYDHCYNEAKAVELIALYYGFTHNEAHEMGDNAFQSCVDQVNLDAAAAYR